MSQKEDELNLTATWPRAVIDELCRCFESSLEESDSGAAKVSTSKLIPGLTELFVAHRDAQYTSSFVNNLKAQLTKDRLTLNQLIGFLEPFLKECIDFGQFNLKPQQPIGLKDITRQVHEQLSRRGIDFNVMVVGSSGAGKSTLINTIFKCIASRRHHERSPKNTNTPEKAFVCGIKCIHHVIEEEDLRLRLCIYDTVGYGDLINNTNCHKCVITKIKETYNEHLKKECEVARNPLRIDSRIHAVIYVIRPTGHCLTELDIQCMQDLSSVVNLIPVIGRSDSLNPEELTAFKFRVRKDMAEHRITFFPELHHEACTFTPATVQSLTAIEEKVPLAVVGANAIDESKMKMIRRNAFSVIDIFDPSISDMAVLLDLLINKHMIALIDTTDKIFYEKYRSNIMQSPKSDFSILCRYSSIQGTRPLVS